jgi:hypothetical protein
MMRSIAMGLLVALGLGSAMAGPVAEPSRCQGTCPCKVCRPSCPDDYHGKPPPGCPYPVNCAGCNDYCPKLLPPSPFRVICFESDEYCARKLPCIAPMCYPAWYTCAPCVAGCPSDGAKRPKAP